ncbi:hypothetical protein J1N35_034143 [Gossypium stocksii]|uniref:DUF4283 domain-containing protein n=1 Tax=Gossypium stocksii TaxID=47602 RepID=A0A9D3ZPX9_9ROSI|nr:hypothetical protein J1N35_034143 [Gossypium stocksii]
MWSLRNPIQIMVLENDYYLVHFQDEEDYNKITERILFGVSSLGYKSKHWTVTKIDEHANAVRRGRFACLAVSVDLRKPLISKVKINKCIQYVEYVSLQNVYFKCRLYGHNMDWCMTNNEPLPDCQANWGTHTNIVEGLQKRVEKEAFRPWMLIECWHRGKGWSMRSLSRDREHRVMRMWFHSLWDAMDDENEVMLGEFELLGMIMS